MVQIPPTKTRLAPLPQDANPEFKEAFAEHARRAGFVPNAMLIMQRKPKLLRAFYAMSAAVSAPDNEVPAGFNRLLAYAASKAHGCHY